MNKTLLAGLTITLIIIAASILGPYMAPHNLSYHAVVEYPADENGDHIIIAPPFPPRAENPFGTDKLGIDMMAKLVAGAKYTILTSIAIAAVRIIAGGGIGMLLGYLSEGKTSKTGRFRIWHALNGIPIFIIVWMMMIGITINTTASALTMTCILSVVLTIAGIPAVISTVKEKTMVLREKQFVLSATSIGASRWTIIRTHLFPHLMESFLILFVQEIVLILSLFGQLGIFNIFVGGTLLYPDKFDPIFASRTNEWSGLIGQARSNLHIYRWVLFIPLAAYIAYIIGFHLIGTGLEKLFKQKFSKFSHI